MANDRRTVLSVEKRILFVAFPLLVLSPRVRVRVNYILSFGFVCVFVCCRSFLHPYAPQSEWM